VKDDELLALLKDAARRDPERGRAEAWERLASGSASADEKARLEAAAEAWGETGAADAVAPLGAAARERIVARAIGAARPNVVPMRRRRTIAVVAAFAVAAAVGLAIMLPRGSDALPAYELAMSGGVSAARGDAANADDVLVVRAGTRLDIVLRPARDVTQPIEVLAALSCADRATAVSLPAEISATGSIRVSADAPSLFGDAIGACTLVLAVAPKGAIRNDAESIVAAGANPRARVFRRSIRVEGR
jgi:hypothetical protein